LTDALGNKLGLTGRVATDDDAELLDRVGILRRATFSGATYTSRREACASA
jgi:hypothetical protein